MIFIIYFTILKIPKVTKYFEPHTFLSTKYDQKKTSESENLQAINVSWKVPRTGKTCYRKWFFHLDIMKVDDGKKIKKKNEEILKYFPYPFH